MQIFNYIDVFIYNTTEIISSWTSYDSHIIADFKWQSDSSSSIIVFVPSQLTAAIFINYSFKENWCFIT